MDVKSSKNHSIKTAMYSLKMRPLYALITYHDPSALELRILKEVRDHLKRFYAQRDFILINKRLSPATFDPMVYKHSLKNMKGIAVVSEYPNLRDQLIEEQKIWKRSFAYFRNFKDARRWALDCFDNNP